MSPDGIGRVLGIEIGNGGNGSVAGRSAPGVDADGDDERADPLAGCRGFDCFSERGSVGMTSTGGCAAGSAGAAEGSTTVGNGGGTSSTKTD